MVSVVSLVYWLPTVISRQEIPQSPELRIIRPSSSCCHIPRALDKSRRSLMNVGWNNTTTHTHTGTEAAGWCSLQPSRLQAILWFLE